MRGCPEEPELGTLIWELPLEVERAYEIVGVEEVGRPGRWNLVLERVSWEEFMATSEERWAFGFTRDRR